MKSFIFTILKTLNPRYYTQLGDRSMKEGFKYFLKLLLVAFILTSLLFIPTLYFIGQDLRQSSLDISRLKLDFNLETVKPVSIPESRPVITFDTTDNKTMDSEVLLITGDSIKYKILFRENDLELGSYDFADSREESIDNLSFIILILLPFIFICYYAIYLAKYFLIIIPTALITLPIAKAFRNKITPEQAIALSFYTSTIMIFIELFTLPFFIKDYLLSFSPFVGITFSLVAITAYLTLFVTAVRINGSSSV